MRFPPASARYMQNTAERHKWEVGENAWTLTIALLQAVPASSAAAAGQQALAEGLLRSQALHAAARQLAAATEGLQRGPQPPSEISLLLASLSLGNVLGLAAGMMESAKEPHGRAWLGPLAVALAETAVMEHAARLVLTPLRRHMAMFSKAYNACATLLHSATGVAASPQAPAAVTPAAAAPIIQPQPADAAAAAGQLRRVLSGPCARHAALVLGLAALRELEGRPVGEEAPCPCHIQGINGPDNLGKAALGAVAALHPQLSPGPHRLLAARLLLRVGFAAAAGGRVQAAEGAGGSRQPAPPQQRTAASVAIRCRIVRWALPQLTSSVLSLRPWLGPRAAVAADVWRLAAALARHEVLGEGATLVERGSVGECLGSAALARMMQACREAAGFADAGGRGCWRFPAEPPPEVAAALAGGALPFLERLLRRAGTAPEGLEGVALAYLGKGSGGLDCALPLLAYGEPLQAGAFVATVTKLLRRTDTQALLRAWRPDGQGAGPSAVSHVVMCVDGPLTHTPAASPPLGRLALVLSLALPEWLPELSRLVRQAAAEDEEAWRQEQQQRRRRRRRRQPLRQEHEAQASEGGAATDCGRELYLSIGALLACLSVFTLPTAGSPILPSPAGPSAASAPATATAAASGGGVGAGGGGGDGTGGGGVRCWRWGVVEEAEVVAVVGAVLALLHRRRPDPKAWGNLYVLVAAWALDLAVGWSWKVRGALEDASSASAWRPGAVRGVAEVLRGLEGRTKLAAAMEHLAKQLEAWASGEEAGGLALGEWEEDSVVGTLGVALAGLLVPPAEARRRLGLPACSNPACANLAGDSEAGLRLRQCGGCGQASYCCRECQTAHWRSGHKEACGGGSGGGSGSGGAGGDEV
ncbi:hypothetical protein HYH03_001262 [Edaphochlamys debaryana]|uniref:phytol kinase n=1 Tax=Edaphochlamys debaryana TaxID=47281 RepID=A0A835YPI6_9CHLO|nr:hypothetical protein HYH03_001262 [Edaphochlamys debaryana]|eukprot:KAG2501484.1 hypothetical protein HYH03_001262 [Edaphochlamys debaryana]